MHGHDELPLEHPDRLGERRECPRVWVEEIQFFAGPDRLIRRVPFYRGLNVIWAPDEADEGGARGHDAGKTLLCRFLRFILGEPTFASPHEMNRIRSEFPEGYSVARVHVANQPWVVLRAFDDAGQHDAYRSAGVPDGIPRDLSGGLAAYRHALRSTLGWAEGFMPPSGPEPWLATLQWIARDQRHLDTVLGWRPTKRAWRGQAVLALLRLARGTTISDGRSKVSRTAREKYAADLARAMERVAQLESRIEPDRAQDVASLPVDDAMRERALQGRLVQLQSPLLTLPRLQELDKEVKAHRRDVLNLSKRHSADSAQLKILGKQLKQLVSELTRIQESLEDHWSETHSCCPLCKRPFADSAEMEAHRVELEQREVGLRQKVEEHTREHDRLSSQVDGHEELLTQSEERLAEFLREREALRAEDAERMIAHGRELATVEALLRDMDALRKARASLAELRKSAPPDKPPSPVRRPVRGPPPDLSQWATFVQALDAMTKELFGSQARAVAKRGEDNIEVQFQETEEHPAAGPALTALGVLVFDLAALRLAIADKADLPGLWIHDSPRDANLGPGRYEALVRALIRLHAEFSSSFQYILTTTEQPPGSLADLGIEPIRLGSAAEGDLLLGRRY